MSRDLKLKKSGRLTLDEQPFEMIRDYVLDPEHSDLPEDLKPRLDRVMSAARLLDDYPSDTHVIRLLQAKYHVTVTQLRKDIALAKELYKTKHTFDWDFWHMWQINDQVELIRKAKAANDLKAWNNAKKVLADLIGERPEVSEDPRRMEKNTFVLQTQYNGQTLNIDLSKIQHLPQEVRSLVLKECLYEQADDAQIEEIMNS